MSIDDHEVHNLRHLLDEIFGPENFVAQIIWQHSVQPKGYSGIYSIHHNHILSYSRTDAYEIQSLDRTEADDKAYSNPDNDPRGRWRTGDVRNALYRPNLRYEIPTPSGGVIKPPDNGWRWSRKTMQEKMNSGEISFSSDETRIIRRIYLEDQQKRLIFSLRVRTTGDAVMRQRTCRVSVEVARSSPRRGAPRRDLT